MVVRLVNDDIPALHKKSSPALIKFYLFIVSSSLSTGPKNYSLNAPLKDDKTTPMVKEIIYKAKQRLIGVSILPDQKIRIQTELTSTCKKHNPDILIISGGTGVTPKDVSTEAILPLLQKRLTGFETVFHQLSYDEIGPATILSRATAGIYENCVVFVLPGSPKAVQLALEKIILPEAGHLLAMIRSQ